MTTKTKTENDRFKGLRTQQVKAEPLPKNQGGPVDIPPEIRTTFNDRLSKDVADQLAEQLSNIQKQLAATVEKVARQRGELNDLRVERAKLTLDGKPTSTADKYINELAAEVNNGPVAITLLHKQLASLKAQIAQFDRNTFIEQQKEAAHQMERLSAELVSLLEKASMVNTTLQACERNYVKLKEKTGVDVGSAHSTHGSDGSLKTLYETCKAECESQRSLRPPVMVGVTPI